MAFYDFENRTAFNPETGEGTPNAVGQVFAKTDTTFATPLVVTLMGSGLSVTDLTTDQYCQLQGFQAEDLVQVVFKSGDFTKVLNTTTPLVGPAGPAVSEAVDNGDNTVTFLLEDGSPAATVTLPESTVPGPPGPEGPQGIPGPDAIPADEAVATYATTPGTATNTALSATIAGEIEPVSVEVATKVTGKDYDAMRPFRAAVGDRSGGGCRIYVRGSSTAEGAMATSYDRTWQRLLLNTLRERYPARPGVTHDTGPGFWPPYYQMEPYPARVGTSVPTDPPKFSSSGLAGKGQWIASGQSRTFTFTGTHFDIWYNKLNEASTLTYTVDGGAAVEVPIQNATVQVAVAQSAALTAGAHTVVISAKAGSFGPIPFLGFMPYNGSRAAGFHLWEGGYSGRTTRDWVDSSVVNFERWTDAVGLINPHLVIDVPWLNDVVLSGWSAAEAKAAQQQVIDKVNAKCASEHTYLLVLGWLRKDVPEQNDPWEVYKEKAYELAAENPHVTVLDVGDAVGTPTDKSLGIWQDNTHLNDRGMGLMADLIGDYLTAR